MAAVPRIHDLSTPALEAALWEHGVVAVSRADLDDAGLVATLGKLGEAMFTSGEVAVEGHPSLNVVTNMGRDRPPRSRFHTDSSYYRRPPAYTGLRPVTVPEQGGDTLFIDTVEAASALPRRTREALWGRRVRHVVTGVEPEPGEETESWQPLFRKHPSGRVALFITVPERCVEVEGLDADASREAVAELYAFATSRPVLRHSWRAGDLLVWDNRTTLHRGDHAEVVGERTLHRGMARGEVPILAA